MKRLLSIGLALSLLGSSAAIAHESAHDYRHSNYGHSAPYRSGYGYRNNDNGGAAAAVGVGILALGLFGALAAQNNNHYDEGYYAPPPSRGYYGYGSYAPSYGSYAPSYGGYYRYSR
jgi:hypothetical protein